MSYASGTSVSVERTRAEIENLVSEYGAEQFASGWHGNVAQVGFVIRNRAIKMTLELPERRSEQFTMSTHKNPWARVTLSEAAAQKKWEQSCRARWRALLLVIKAKLEATSAGISTIEQEFMAFTVVPGTNGRTLGEVMLPQIAEAIEKDKKPQLLLPGGA